MQYVKKHEVNLMLKLAINDGGFIRTAITRICSDVIFSDNNRLLILVWYKDVCSKNEGGEVLIATEVVRREVFNIDNVLCYDIISYNGEC